MNTYWVSLAPETGRARVVIVDAISKGMARIKVVELGLLKPDDEWFVAKIPPGEPELGLPRDRVITDEELLAVGAVSMSDVQAEMLAIAYETGALKRPS